MDKSLCVVADEKIIGGNFKLKKPEATLARYRFFRISLRCLFVRSRRAFVILSLVSDFLFVLIYLSAMDRMKSRRECGEPLKIGGQVRARATKKKFIP